MTKKIALVSLALSLVLCSLVTVTEAKTWNLRFTGSDFESHPSVANGLLPWIKEVEKATNGQVKICYFNPNTICPVNEVVSSIEKGAISMGAIDHARNAGKFPLHDVFVLPLLSGNSTAQGVTAWRIYTKTPALQKEMAKVKVLGYWGGGSLHVMTKSKAVQNLDDMKGLRVACLSKPFADVVSTLGGNPIIVPLPDIYLTLSRNIADSTLFSLLAAGSIKIQNIIKHVTVASLIKDVRFMGMNWDVWNSFPPEIQKAIESTCCSEEWARKMSQAMDNGDISGRKLLDKCGAKFYTLEPEEHAKWVKTCVPLDQRWVDKVVKLGAATREETENLLKEVRATGAEVTAGVMKK